LILSRHHLIPTLSLSLSLLTFADAGLFDHVFGLLKKHDDYPSGLVSAVLECVKSLLRDSPDNVALFRKLCVFHESSSHEWFR
jgi:hypothetical protein